MKESAERNKIMKNFAVIALLALVAFVTLSATPSHAQTLIKGDVPFSFYAGSRMLPAGQYSITDTGNQLAMLLSSGPKGIEFLMPKTTDLRSDLQVPKLVFLRYGDEYFLAEIWSDVDGSVRILPAHPRERLLAKSGASPQVAVVYSVSASTSGN